MDPTVYIEQILVRDDVRMAVVTNPHNHNRNTHGLGRVGESIRPFLGHRGEGYYLGLDEIPPVFLIDSNGTPDRRGRFPRRRVALATLQAPDLSLSDFDDAEVSR